MAKSVSIKVGADTSEFLKSLKSLDSQIKNTTKTATELEKGLKIDYDSKTAIQAQKQLQKALETTNEKAKAIKDQMAFLEKEGQVNTEGYEKLQLELAKTETTAKSLEQQLKEIDQLNFDKVGSSVEKVGTQITNAGKTVSVFSAAVIAAGKAAVDLAKDAISTGDEIATLATNYDMSTTAIQKWEYVALQSDVDNTTLLKSFQKLNSALGDQLVGTTNTATEALSKLGIDVNNFEDSDQAFEATIKAISELGSVTEQTAVASDIFGERYASSLVSLFQQGDEAISSYLEEFEKTGYLSEEVVSALSNVDNEMNLVNTQYENAKTQLGVALIPIYQKLISVLTDYVIPAIEKLTSWFNSLSDEQQNQILTIAGIIAVAGPMLILLGKITTGIGALIKILPTLKALLTSTTGGFVALAGAIALGVNLVSNWSQMSTLSKVLSALAIAALTAAAAMTIFHASWSVGLAVGAIVAAIAVGIAAVKAAGKDIGVDTSNINESGVNVGNSATGLENYTTGNTTTTTNTSSNTDNSTKTYNVEINVNAEEGVDIDELTEQIAKNFVAKVQALS